MNSQTRPVKKAKLKVCADMKAYTEEREQPKQMEIPLMQGQCSGNLCALTDWKPRKQPAA